MLYHKVEQENSWFQIFFSFCRVVAVTAVQWLEKGEFISFTELFTCVLLYFPLVGHILRTQHTIAPAMVSSNQVNQLSTVYSAIEAIWIHSIRWFTMNINIWGEQCLSFTFYIMAVIWIRFHPFCYQLTGHCVLDRSNCNSAECTTKDQTLSQYWGILCHAE